MGHQSSGIRGEGARRGRPQGLRGFSLMAGACFALGFGASAAVLGVGGGSHVSVSARPVAVRATQTPGYSLHRGLTCPGGDVLTVVAHQDDFAFFLPDLQTWIRSDACVTMLQLTAGDDGLGTAYWQGRDSGMLAAFGVMANLAGRVWTSQEAWSEGTFTAAGKAIREYWLTYDPRITILAMLLPDGLHANDSLYALASRHASSIGSLDPAHPNTYSQLSLEQFLTATYRAVAPDRINIQDALLPANTNGAFTGTLSGQAGDPKQDINNYAANGEISDHPDHINGARDALAAALNGGWTSRPWTVVSYLDSPTAANQPGFYDVAPTDYPRAEAQKWEAWKAYAQHDPLMHRACPDQSMCEKRLPGYFRFIQGECVAASWSSMPTAASPHTAAGAPVP